MKTASKYQSDYKFYYKMTFIINGTIKILNDKIKIVSLLFNIDTIFWHNISYILVAAPACLHFFM